MRAPGGGAGPCSRGAVQERRWRRPARTRAAPSRSRAAAKGARARARASDALPVWASSGGRGCGGGRLSGRLSGCLPGCLPGRFPGVFPGVAPDGEGRVGVTGAGVSERRSRSAPPAAGTPWTDSTVPTASRSPCPSAAPCSSAVRRGRPGPWSRAARWGRGLGRGVRDGRADSQAVVAGVPDPVPVRAPALDDRRVDHDLAGGGPRAEGQAHGDGEGLAGGDGEAAEVGEHAHVLGLRGLLEGHGVPARGPGVVELEADLLRPQGPVAVGEDEHRVDAGAGRPGGVGEVEPPVPEGAARRVVGRAAVDQGVEREGVVVRGAATGGGRVGGGDDGRVGGSRGAGGSGRPLPGRGSPPPGPEPRS